jgi:hypothetical protein
MGHRITRDKWLYTFDGKSAYLSSVKTVEAINSEVCYYQQDQEYNKERNGEQMSQKANE